MSIRSREKQKRRQGIAGKAQRMLASLDRHLFMEALNEITPEIARPYVVRRQEERPSFQLTDTGESFTVNTDQPLVRIHLAASRFCHTGELDTEIYLGPIAARVQALWRVIEELKNNQSFQSFIVKDQDGEIVSVRNDVVGLAASCPFRNDIVAFDPESFLTTLLALNGKTGPGTGSTAG